MKIYVCKFVKQWMFSPPLELQRFSSVSWCWAWALIECHNFKDFITVKLIFFLLSFSFQVQLITSKKYIIRRHLQNATVSKVLKWNRKKPRLIMLIKLSSTACNVVIIAILILKISSAAHADIYKNARLGTRIVQTRYGRLQGLVLPLDNFKFLKPVEVFLSVPYATPPTRSNR